MNYSKDVLRIMESSLSLKQGSLEKSNSFKPKVQSIDPIDIKKGQWKTSWEEGNRQISLFTFLNEETNRHGLVLEVLNKETSEIRTCLYHREFLSSDDARQEIVDIRESAVRGGGLRSIGYLGPKWR